jgi:hypothetical protein
MDVTRYIADYGVVREYGSVQFFQVGFVLVHSTGCSDTSDLRI